MNRKLVFRSRTGFAKSAVQYIALAALILAGNTIVLSMLAGTFGIDRLIAKLITEALFFVISWTVQKYVIFFSNDAEAEAGVAGEEEAA
jgi:putative flippase GtrA